MNLSSNLSKVPVSHLSGVPLYMAEKSGTASSLVRPAATQGEYRCREKGAEIIKLEGGF